MAAVELTKAAIEAIKREARSQLENAIGERHCGRRLGQSDYEAKIERDLLVCADVLGEIQYVKVGWALQDPREEDCTRAVDFPEQAIGWMREQREATAGRIVELETSGEAEYDANAEEVFLHHVLTRVLDGQREAVTV